MNLNKPLFRYDGANIGVETVEGKQTLVAYFQPDGTGYVCIPNIDVSRMEPKTIAGSRRVRRAIDRSSKVLRGIY